MTAIIGYAPGAYDLFHVGHLNILKHAKQRCDILVAGVVSDEMCLAAKGRLPFIPVAERMAIVQHIVYVDDVHEETTPDKLDAWRAVRFHRIFKGDDWRGTPKGDKLESDFSTWEWKSCTSRTPFIRRAPTSGPRSGLPPTKVKH